nr:DUF4328 domain-containing protein [uncultured Pseudomonas sp.]
MSEDKGNFINSDSLIRWVRYFLFAQIIVAVVSLASGAMEYQLLSAYENGIYTSHGQAVADGEANDARQAIIAMVYLAVSIVSGIVILKWIYRANYNARQLGAKGMEFTPGWSIGWYFIPVATLWKPYQAMKEIWKASSDPGNWKEAKVSAILPWWWFFWLATNFIGQAVFRISLSAKDIPELQTANILYQISDVAAIFLAFITLLLVNGVYKSQAFHASNDS